MNLHFLNMKTQCEEKENKGQCIEGLYVTPKYIDLPCPPFLLLLIVVLVCNDP